jgi:hypothetical protein
MVMIENVLGAISDDKSLILFKTIAIEKPNSEVLIAKTQLTRKQYYSRMERFMKTDLVKRENGKYKLTTLGKVVYHAETIIESAFESLWKLKAVDSFEVTDALSREELTKVMDTLIDNEKIKQILLAKES